MSKRHKRVWFIGAGFTAGVGYPLGSTLVAELVTYLKGRKTGLLRFAPPSIRKAFVNSVAHPKLSVPRELVLRNIAEFSRIYLARDVNKLENVQVAEFFSIAQALAEQDILGRETARSARKDGARAQPQLKRLYYDLTAVTRSYFVDICNAVEDKWPADFKSVLDQLDPEVDAIVNFNWDEEVDCYLSSERGEHFDIDYTAGEPADGHFLLLKPHGSIGWYDVSQCIANDDIYFVAEEDHEHIERFEKRLISYEEFNFPQDINDGPGDLFGEFLLSCPPVITPPTFGKQFKYREQSLIWRDVINTCRRADEFIFLGYSVPPDDFLTRAAIRCALAERKKKASRNRARCMVVTTPESVDRVLHNFNFSQVFESPLAPKHVLQWTIGKRNGRKNLYDTIEDGLKSATL